MRWWCGGGGVRGGYRSGGDGGGGVLAMVFHEGRGCFRFSGIRVGKKSLLPATV